LRSRQSSTVKGRLYRARNGRDAETHAPGFAGGSKPPVPLSGPKGPATPSARSTSRKSSARGKSPMRSHQSSYVKGRLYRARNGRDAETHAPGFAGGSKPPVPLSGPKGPATPSARSTSRKSSARGKSPMRSQQSSSVKGRTGGRAVLENVPPTLRACLGTFSRGAPPGMAWRRSASQPPSRPSRRPEVAGIARGW
jgi:hypothetical protein